MPVPLIRPISDLRTDLNDVCEQAEETHQPIFMTKNGKPNLVVFNSDAYEEMLNHQRYVQKLREAEIEAKYVDKTYSQDEVDEAVNRIFEKIGA